MSPHYTQQFLNSVLSDGSPAALPYADGTKWYIRQHMVHLTEAYPNLQPKTAVFTHNDGRAANLLQADGTIPMTFLGATYNIPVIIWLMESYPHHAPLVFVNPTRDMTIKRHHPFVSPNGVVSVPYVHSWVFPASNLVDLARNLSFVFGRDPPLYSHPNCNPNPSNSLNSKYGSMNPLPGLDNSIELLKKNAIIKLVESFNGDIKEIRKATEGGIEGLFNAQAELRNRDEELTKGLKEMQDEKEALEQQLQMVLMNTDILEQWLRESEAISRSSVDTDEAFKPCDALSKQILDSTASDMAVEDALYALDKAVQEGAVPFDQYLRNVRLLSRNQFFDRAMATKAGAVQMQARVASMGRPQY